MIKHYRTDTGIEVDIIRRPLLIVQSELAEDLKPFFHVASLFQYANGKGIVRPFKGKLLNVEVQTSENIVLTFAPFDVPPVKRHLSRIRSSTLTIWRVNNVLDALQVFISTDDTAVYLQTGGDALLLSLTALTPVDTSTPEAVDLFNEPILSLREWGSPKTHLS